MRTLIIFLALSVVVAIAHVESECHSDCDRARIAKHVPKAIKCTLPPKRTFPIPGSRRGLGYYANAVLGEPSDAFTLAVSYQHGMYSDPDVHYCAILEAYKRHYPGGNSSVLLISPHFQDSWSSVPSDQLYWDGQSWNMGDNSSRSGGVPTISSFSVYDHLVSVLSNKAIYPRMKRIVLSGHSAGGQTMVRYALGTQTPEPEDGLRLVVMNPSTFPYLNRERPSPPTTAVAKWVIPTTSEISRCPSYNTWRYGLDGLNEYMKRVSIDRLLKQFSARDVVYLMGTADTCNEYLTPGCDSHGLDKGCQAMFQGRQRYERGQVWMRFLEHMYNAKVHLRVDVADVAHDETEMIIPRVSTDVLFGR